MKSPQPPNGGAPLEAITSVCAATYDGDGLRATKTDSAGTRAYDTDGGSTILRETLNGSPVMTYTPGASQRSGMGDRFYHPDWLGSSRYMTDGLQATTAAAAWSAYGRKEGSTGEAYPSDFQWGGAWGTSKTPTRTGA